MLTTVQPHLAIRQPPKNWRPGPKQFARRFEFGFTNLGDGIRRDRATVMTLSALAVARALDEALPPGLRQQGDRAAEAVRLVVRVGNERNELGHRAIVGSEHVPETAALHDGRFPTFARGLMASCPKPHSKGNATWPEGSKVRSRLSPARGAVLDAAR